MTARFASRSRAGAIAGLLAAFAMAGLLSALAAPGGGGTAERAKEKQAEEKAQSSAEAAPASHAASPLVQAAAAARAASRLPTRKDPETGEEVIVIDNRTLERLYGPASPARPAEPSGPQNKWWLRRSAPAPAGPSPQVQERIRKIEQELERLRRNKLALHNPFLPRPQLNEDEAKELSGMDNVQRLRQTQKRIRELEAELAKLRQQAGGGASPAR